MADLIIITGAAGLQTGPSPSNGVFTIEHAAPVAELDQTESFFHNSLQYGRAPFRAEKDCVGIARDSAGLAFLVHKLVHNQPPESINSLPLKRFRAGGEGRNRSSQASKAK